MTGAREEVLAATPNEMDASLASFTAMVVKRRRLIASTSVITTVAVLIVLLVAPRKYRTDVTFIPQSSEGGTAGLALAASQFGIRVPTAGYGFGTYVYVELLKSRTLLEPIARESVTVAEEGGKRVAVPELFGIDGGTANERTEMTIAALRTVIFPSEQRRLGAVQLAVTTGWASVSLQLAERLVAGVNEFNLTWRRSQASAERQFVQDQASVAEKALRDAEDRMQRFVTQNRVLGSPELVFERDRLNRQVALRQQVYTSMMQNLEEAKSREVRDTPVITLLEEPRLALRAEPRRLRVIGSLVLAVSVIAGISVALMREGVERLRVSESPDARLVVDAFREALPARLRGWLD